MDAASVAAALGVFDPRTYGATFNGITDDSAAIQRCFDAAFAVGSRAKVEFPPCKTAKINTGLTLRSGRVVVDFGSCILDASGMLSGYALTVLPNPAPPFSANIVSLPISNLILSGPQSESHSTDGIFIGRLSGGGEAAGILFETLIVRGFRDGIYMGDQCWLVRFFNFQITQCWRTGVTCDLQVNAGENISFIGGWIANIVNTGGTGACVLTPEGADAGVFFQAVSFDYSDVLIDHTSGSICLYGCHLEDNRSTSIGLRSGTFEGA